MDHPAGHPCTLHDRTAADRHDRHRARYRCPMEAQPRSPACSTDWPADRILSCAKIAAVTRDATSAMSARLRMSSLGEHFKQKDRIELGCNAWKFSYMRWKYWTKGGHHLEL